MERARGKGDRLDRLENCRRAERAQKRASGEVEEEKVFQEGSQEISSPSSFCARLFLAFPLRFRMQLMEIMGSSSRLMGWKNNDNPISKSTVGGEDEASREEFHLHFCYRLARITRSWKTVVDVWIFFLLRDRAG